MNAGWQEELRQKLVERNSRESAYAGIIEQYRRLAQQTRMLKERNQSLLRAVGTVKNQPSSGVAGSTLGPGDDAVRNAYIASLESQISSLRDEMAAVYKTQGQNAQRLLAMNETLREKEEVSRLSSDELRRAKDDALVLRRKVEQHNDLMAEKDDRMQTLLDEIQALELELNQVNDRNQVLKQDNASLLSRWIDKMNDEAEKMNSANTCVHQPSPVSLLWPLKLAHRYTN
ncbi:hypothetical protein M407DRAFT_139523 [Tulasnella calospora MUT 4182]|uniref:Autophagy-related protein 16 domain-containing protein n=1 Tax=Tulasnella calospora MUT 4182 TaxID=1051891 RepID=A0A0C3QHE2_9AGAM|nr:hypothetical protein M407DRAFT_145677 [Tulasnella calospora MUT 4182]KIO31250.1 hypothetical protein M407DRAFT_139523 [Tulasnella calospora MUT 4182]